MERIIGHANALSHAPGQAGLPARLANVLVLELASLSEKLLEGTTDTEDRWNRLRQALRELSLLRRDEHNGIGTAIRQERLEMDHAKLAHKQQALAGGKPPLPAAFWTSCCWRRAEPLSLIDVNQAEFDPIGVKLEKWRPYPPPSAQARGRD